MGYIVLFFESSRHNCSIFLQGIVKRARSLALHAMESTMPRRIGSIVSATCGIFVCAVITSGMNGRALAAGECIEQPNREPAPGAHWFYHYDRGKNRKCWYLGVAATREREPESTPGPRDVVVVPADASVFSSLIKKGPSLPPAPQDEIAGEPRIIQSNPTRPLRLEDIAQQRPDLPEEHAEERYIPPLSPVQRRALFQDYLKWEEIQRTLGAVGEPARPR
jgi:hypothetical protein